MEIQLTLHGRKRKDAADCVGEAVNAAPVYLRAPTHNYDIAGIILDRNSVLTIGDCDEALPKVLIALQKAGFYTPETEEVPEAVPETVPETAPEALVPAEADPEPAAVPEAEPEARSAMIPAMKQPTGPAGPNRKIHIRLASEASADIGALNSLKAMLEAHPGDCPVYIHVPVSSGETVIRSKTGADLPLSPEAWSKCAAVAQVWDV